MDKFVYEPITLLRDLLYYLNSPKISLNIIITNEIEKILTKHLSNVKNLNQTPLTTSTNSELQKPSHIYSFILECFTDSGLILSAECNNNNNELLHIKIEKPLTNEILSKLYQNLKCSEESIPIFQLFFTSNHEKFLQEIKDFLKKYPQYKTKFGINGTTMLYAAMQYGNLEIIKYLIEIVKCPLNLQNPKLVLLNGDELLSNGNTPLHAACYFQRLDIVKYLLTRENIDLNLKNSFDQTPKMIVESNKNESILEELKNFSKKIQMFYIERINFDTIDKNYEEILTSKYILKDSESIKVIIQEKFNVKYEKQSLVGIMNIEQEQWITFAILKVKENVFIYFVKDEFSSSYLSRSYERKKDEIREIIENIFKNNFSIEISEN